MNTTEKINQIPRNTWSWLDINNASFDLKLKKPSGKVKFALSKNQNVVIKEIKDAEEDIKSFTTLEKIGVSEEIRDYILKNNNSGYFIKAEKGVCVDVPIVLKYTLGEDDKLYDNTVIVAKENSKLTVVVEYESKDSTKAFHGGLVRV